MNEHDPFTKVCEVLGRLDEALRAEIARAQTQTARLTALDAEAALSYARERAAFTQQLAGLEQELAARVGETARALGLATFEVTDLLRRYPEPARRLADGLASVRAQAATLRRHDMLNRLLADRARACVSAWLTALTGPPAAYDRRGAARDLGGFATTVRSV